MMSALKVRTAKPKPQRRPRVPRKANAGQDKGRTYTVTNVAMITPQSVTVTNSTYSFSAGAIELNLSGLQSAGLTWEAGLMALYDLFKFTKLRLRWVPAVSTFTTGTVGVYYDPDPSAQVPANFRCLTGNAGLRLTQIGRDLTLNVTQAQLSRLPWYNTSTDHSSATQGQIIYAFSPGSMPSGSGAISLGHFLLEYTLVLKNPTSGSCSGTNPNVLPAITQTVVDQITAMHPPYAGLYYQEMAVGRNGASGALQQVGNSYVVKTLSANGRAVPENDAGIQVEADDGLVQRNYNSCSELVTSRMASIDVNAPIDHESLSRIHDLAHFIDEEMDRYFAQSLD